MVNIARLIDLMAQLRTPGSGCPWDLAQTFDSIAPYTLEEAFEVVDAIERRDLEDLKDELGDLLLQVVFHARIAQEQGAFTFDDVAGAISDKLVRRHPHVFDAISDVTPQQVAVNWTAIKAQEKTARAERRRLNGDAEAPSSLLEGVPLPLPALTRATKLQQKAARVGFDWRDAGEVIAKIREETEEAAAELEPGKPASPELTEEIGDLLFAVANLARKCDVDAEQALRRANAKFERRFRHIEARLAETGASPEQASLAEMEALWIEAKLKEKQARVADSAA